MNELAEQRSIRDMSIPERREEIMKLQKLMLKVPGAVTDFTAHYPYRHDFLPGIYVRTIFMKKGDLIVGKIHKLDHVAIISGGRAQVFSEEFADAQIIEAPCIWKSPAGAKRVLLVLEDMTWSTVHPNPKNLTDLALLEAELIAPEYDNLGEVEVTAETICGAV